MYYEIVLAGVAISLLFVELTGLSPAGLIVPGYLALCLQTPWRIVYTLAVAVAAWGIAKLLGNVMILYGRRRFAVMVLLSFAIDLAVTSLGLLAWGTAALAAGQGRRTETGYAAVQLAAADLLEDCFRQVRTYKEELGIPLSELDYHQTGMIGESYTGITTTLGAIEAKRTTAWPEMGALCVRLLHEAGVRSGDTVGAGFSGSFPAMDLAVIAACQVMGVELIYISSVGASTYGANHPALTFPEMAHRLVEDGLLETDSAAVTLGGGGDVGGGMDPACAEEIRGRLAEAGLLLLEEPDYRRNLELRQQLYQQEGPIDCFVAVGGNVTSMGRGESGISLGQGLLSPEKIVRLTEDSGLVQRYLSQGLPVINLLNIKQLAADYGLPYDPAQWPERGTSAVYFETDYPGAVLLLGLAGAAVLLALCRWVRRGAGTARKEERGYHGQTESSADHPDH